MEAYRILSNVHSRAFYDGQIRVESILKGDFEEYEDYDMYHRQQRGRAFVSERYSENKRKQYEARFVVPNKEKNSFKWSNLFENTDNDLLLGVLFVTIFGGLVM